jgi:hypothetical protein
LYLAVLMPLWLKPGVGCPPSSSTVRLSDGTASCETEGCTLWGAIHAGIGGLAVIP